MLRASCRRGGTALPREDKDCRDRLQRDPGEPDMFSDICHQLDVAKILPGNVNLREQQGGPSL